MPACPCGSRQPYHQCCGRFLDHDQLPHSPEELMRSRFTAFRLGHWHYLLESWHPDHKPSLTAEAMAAEQADGRWQCLNVLHSRGGETDDQGEVEFIAWYRDATGLHPHHERSRFVRWQGRWTYTEGTLLPATKPKPNDPCPCDSGLKVKKCCGCRTQ